MGFINFLKRCGFWFDHEGTVFGGKTGDGVLGKIVLIEPYKPAKIEPPKPEGKYPETIDHAYEYFNDFRNSRRYHRPDFVYAYAA